MLVPNETYYFSFILKISYIVRQQNNWVCHWILCSPLTWSMEALSSGIKWLLQKFNLPRGVQISFTDNATFVSYSGKKKSDSLSELLHFILTILFSHKLGMAFDKFLLALLTLLNFLFSVRSFTSFKYWDTSTVHQVRVTIQSYLVGLETQDFKSIDGMCRFKCSLLLWEIFL